MNVEQIEKQIQGLEAKIAAIAAKRDTTEEARELAAGAAEDLNERVSSAGADEADGLFAQYETQQRIAQAAHQQLGRIEEQKREAEHELGKLRHALAEAQAAERAAQSLELQRQAQAAAGELLAQAWALVPPEHRAPARWPLFLADVFRLGLVA